VGRCSLKNVTERAGHLYFRRKIAGKDTYVRLPALDSPEFHDAYAMLSKPDTDRARPAAGTIAALVEAHRASADFRAKRAIST
jgi:hypothetical protein